MAFYAYLVRCQDQSLYGGWTTDLRQRLAKHASGQGAKYTKAKGVVGLAYFEELSSKQEAMRREAALKALAKKDKEALAQGFDGRRLRYINAVLRK